MRMLRRQCEVVCLTELSLCHGWELEWIGFDGWHLACSVYCTTRFWLAVLIKRHSLRVLLTGRFWPHLTGELPSFVPAGLQWCIVRIYVCGVVQWICIMNAFVVCLKSFIWTNKIVRQCLSITNFRWCFAILSWRRSAVMLRAMSCFPS